MAGNMSVQQIQDLVNGLQGRLQSAHSSDELRSLTAAITEARTKLEAELSVDSAAVNAALADQQKFEQEYAAQRQTQYQNKAQEAFVKAEGLRVDQRADVAGIERLNELLKVIQGRQMVDRNPELEKNVGAPLRALKTKLHDLHVPDDGIAPMLSTLQQKNIEPEKAAAMFMVMRAAVSHESEVPPESVNEIAANLTVSQLESGLTPQQVQEAFHYYLELKTTTPGNAVALLSAYANRLSDLANTRDVEITALSADDMKTVREALKDDYEHFVEKTEGDAAIAALLASGVTTTSTRDKVWEQYRFFDDQPGIDSTQAAVLTAGLMGRVTDVSKLPEMRAETLQNYHDILKMAPPDNMQGATLSPFVAAGYAGAGLGPNTQTVRVIRENHGLTFGDLILWNMFLNSHPSFSTGPYSGYSSGYGAGYWAGRASVSSSGPISGTGLPSSTPRTTFTPLSRSLNTNSTFAERAVTGRGAIGNERVNLGAGVGRNTTILTPTGQRTLAQPQITRPAGSTGIVTTSQAAQRRGMDGLGAGVGRNTTIQSGARAPSAPTSSPSSSWGGNSGPSGGGIGRAGPASSGISG